jgi:hypothetical protein
VAKVDIPNVFLSIASVHFGRSARARHQAVAIEQL